MKKIFAGPDAALTITRRKRKRADSLYARVPMSRNGWTIPWHSNRSCYYNWPDPGKKPGMRFASSNTNMQGRHQAGTTISKRIHSKCWRRGPIETEDWHYPYRVLPAALPGTQWTSTAIVRHERPGYRRGAVLEKKPCPPLRAADWCFHPASAHAQEEGTHSINWKCQMGLELGLQKF